MNCSSLRSRTLLVTSSAGSQPTGGGDVAGVDASPGE
jgi:hypothetical protein